MTKLLFIDRDGTLIQEPADYQVDQLEKLAYYPGVFHYLGKIVRELDYELVMVTNQDGLGTSSFPEENFWPVHNHILKTFEGEGIAFKEVLIDRTFAADKAATRKPGTGLCGAYLTGDYDLASSYVIGDRITDMEFALNLGAKGIWLNNEPELGAEETTHTQQEILDTIELTTTDWKAVYLHLRLPVRSAALRRKTKETDINIHLQLDGQGVAKNHTGLGFFDHMLDQLARHSGCNLSVKVDGDLHIDEHHTIEDTAIALGEAFKKAFGNKLGIERYGFCLPMDDCLAQVAIDFGGRNWLVWEAEFKREKIGEMPTEMFHHFFKSFSDGAACNLNIKAEGINEHHKIEAIFKAFAKAIKMAKMRNPDNMQLPSTKGML